MSGIQAMKKEMQTDLRPVLVAEDEENDFFFLQEAFKQAGVGHSLVCVPDGAAAMEFLVGCRALAPDREPRPLPCLLITDLKMPGMSGFDLLEWLRGEQELSALPRIVFSNSAEEVDQRRAAQLGAWAYFQKPSSYTELVALVCDWKRDYLLASQSAVLPAKAGP